MEANTSSKFDRITSKLLIHSGSPSIYQLTPKRDKIGTLTKITLGKKNPTKVNRTILLVGETGAGKSTLINALVNHAIGVKWEDYVWFEIVKEEEKRELESQTSDVIMYEIFGFEDQTVPYSLTIIDTPGFGDTRGTEQDDRVGGRLFDLFRSEDGVDVVDVVGLVLKASDNRLSDRLKYIYDSVVSLFGKNMKDNIIPLVTHSDGGTPHEALKALETAKIKFAMNEDNQPVYFLFNNCQGRERSQDVSALVFSWDTTKRGMEEFTKFLHNLLPKSLKTTTQVLNSRIALTACIQNLQERVQGIEKKQSEIDKIQEALKEHEEEMKRNADFTVKVDEVYKDKETVDGRRKWWSLWLNYEGAVTCTVCEENCHFPGCTMAWYPSDCEVMKKGRCTSCTNKCPVSEHVKEQKIYVTKTREVEMTLKDVKEKYEKVKTDCRGVKSHSEDLEKAKEHSEDPSKAEEHFKTLEKAMGTVEVREKELEQKKAEIASPLDDLKREKLELQKDKDKWLEESFQHVLNLEKIALNIDSLSTHVHLDFLIEKMTERGDSPEKDKFKQEVQKLEEIKSRADEKTKAALQYKRTAAGKADEAKTK